MRVASLKRVGLCWCVAWPLRGRSCARNASTRESSSIRQLSLQSKFLPSFRERYSPPNPESASMGRNLSWRNSNMQWQPMTCRRGQGWNCCLECIYADFPQTVFCICEYHWSDITWASWHLESLNNRLLVQHLVEPKNNEISNSALLPSAWEYTLKSRFISQRTVNTENVFISGRYYHMTT